MASYLHRTAQPPTLATFRSWGSSAGAGRIRLAAAKIRISVLGMTNCANFDQKLMPGLSVRESTDATPIRRSALSVKNL